MLARSVAAYGFGIGLSAVAGVAAATSTGLAALGIGSVFAAAAWLTLWRYYKVPVVTVAVLGVWAGYVWFNRDFADLHLSLGPLPVYVGELLLLMSLPWAASRVEWRRVQRTPFFIMLAAWMAFCAVRLIAGGLDYGIDALRDSAIWYYGLFSLVGYVLWRAVSPEVWTRYFTVVFIALIVVTTGSLVSEALGLTLQTAPREDVLAASLIAAANFFLLAQRSAGHSVLRLLLSSMALALLVPLEVRSATIGVFILLGIFALQRRWSTLLSMIGIPVVVFILLAVANVPLPGRVGSTAGEFLDRQLSVVPLLLDGRVASNDVSLPSDSTTGTAVWRYTWWSALIQDTLSTPEQTLVGVGFGADITWPLGMDQSNTERPLRSPHNIAVNLFARTGVIGVVLWVVMLGVWLYSVLRGIDRALRAGKTAESDRLLWMCTYAVTILVVALLGVVLESPLAAIPFFLLLGMAVRNVEEFTTIAEPAVVGRVARLPTGGMIWRRPREVAETGAGRVVSH